jgi:hypothetical protein
MHLLSAIQKGIQRKGIAIDQDIIGAGMYIVDYNYTQKVLRKSKVLDDLSDTDPQRILTYVFLETADTEYAV